MPMAENKDKSAKNKLVIADGPPLFSLMGIVMVVSRLIGASIKQSHKFPTIFHATTIITGAIVGAFIAIFTSLIFAYVLYFIVHIGFVGCGVYAIAHYTGWDAIESFSWSFGFFCGIGVGMALLSIPVIGMNASSVVSRVISMLLSLSVLWWWIIKNEMAIGSTTVGLVFKSVLYVVFTLFAIFIACVPDDEEEEKNNHKRKKKSKQQ